MATLLSGSAFGQKLLARKEGYGNTTPSGTVVTPTPVTSASHETINPNPPGLISLSTVIWVIIELVFYTVIGGFAAWLSWNSNSSIGWHPVFCVIFSILAFFCAGTYLTGHLLFKLDLLLALRAGKSLLSSSSTPRANPVPNPARTYQVPANGSHQSR